MHPPFTFAIVFNYVILFITKGLPIIIATISLLRLFTRTGSDSVQLPQCLPDLIVILACISMLALTWSSTLGLALVCTASIVMSKLPSGK